MKMRLFFCSVQVGDSGAVGKALKRFSFWTLTSDKAGGGKINVSRPGKKKCIQASFFT